MNLYFILLIYLCSFIFIFVCRFLIIKNISFINNFDERKALSFSWAWLNAKTQDNIFGNHICEKYLHALRDQPEIKLIRLILPHVNFVILAILFYQLIRPTSIKGLGYCLETPNCSNYSLGCFLRFGFFTALNKAFNRCLNCSGTHDVSFSDSFD